MQINSMLPALLNILTGQAGQNKVDKSASKQGMGEIFRQVVEAPLKGVQPPGVNSPAEAEPKHAPQQPAGNNLPDFLPLPLKSPLFEESRFFIKNYREDSAEQENERPCSVFINLRTDNMGSLWIHLMAKSQSLTLSFYTEKEYYTSLINKSFSELVEDLTEIGFSSVKVAGITRPGIKSCEDIVPGSGDSQNYLLNLEV
ncbi:MAG: hypothetical protein ACOY46_20560 [Bacillota bacterium]